jgi:hypothetical protein
MAVTGFHMTRVGLGSRLWATTSRVKADKQRSRLSQLSNHKGKAGNKKDFVFFLRPMDSPTYSYLSHTVFYREDLHSALFFRFI